MNRPVPNYGSTSNIRFSDDISTEFNNLCDGVVTNIYTVNQSMRTLDNALKTIGTKKDNQGLRNQLHVTQSSTNQIASETSREINKLKTLASKSDKQRQLQVEKLEENFKEAVSRYYALQKEVLIKQKANLLVSVNIENEGSPDEDAELQEQRQAQLTREMAFEQDMLLEREALVKRIELDVLDINQVMRDLGSMVHLQGEAIDTIENSIDHAAGNIEEGAEQVLKASRYQSRYRKKLLYLVILCLIIIGVIITIIVVSVKR